MDTTSANHFRDNLKAWVDKVINDHEPLKVSRRGGKSFVVISEEDWERDQETLFVLQNQSLMEQIAQSAKTHQQDAGRPATDKEVDEILGI